MRYQLLFVSQALAFHQAHTFVMPALKSSLLLGPFQQPSSLASSHVLLSAHHNVENNDISLTNCFDPLEMASPSSSSPSVKSAPNTNLSAIWVGTAAVALCTTPTVALAAAGDAIPSAFAAYVHYLSLLLITASVMTERLTVKPAMSIDEEKLLGYADIMTGVAGTALAASGYFRATAYGKGWDFYSHEPIFWLKMTFLGIFGGLSLFPTITIIQRTVKIQQEGTIDPMSEELANRLKKVMNAELTALATIPLTASLMARGVGYVNEFPTQIVGPVLFGVVTAGAVYKYVKDAISWKEDGLSAVGMEEE